VIIVYREKKTALGRAYSEESEFSDKKVVRMVLVAG